mgnify:FL=1
MIVRTVSENQFVEAFDTANRSNNFSVEARRALFDYLEELSDDMGESIELDPIAICCDWSEYTETELVREFGHIVDIYPDNFECQWDDIGELLDALRDIGVLIEVPIFGESTNYLFAE